MKYIQDDEIRTVYLNKIKENEILSSSFFPHMKLVLYQKNEYIYQQEQDLAYLYIFVDGKVKVSLFSSNGKETIFRILRQPRLIGEMEFITNKEAFTDVEAIEDSLCFLLPLHICSESLLHDITFLKYCCTNMAEALSHSNMQFANNQSFPPVSRVASYILSIYKQDDFHLDYKIMSNIIGISERHIFRIMSSFMDQNIIEKNQKVYKITNKAVLEKISADSYII